MRLGKIKKKEVGDFFSLSLLKKFGQGEEKMKMFLVNFLVKW